MNKPLYHRFISSVLWNLFLISAGSLVFGLGLKSIAIPHGFITGGVLMGTGSGLILHSLGSGGGLDIIGIILNQRFSLRLGTFYFAFNVLGRGFSKRKVY